MVGHLLLNDKTFRVEKVERSLPVVWYSERNFETRSLG